MASSMPEIYKYHPRTYTLPQQFQDLKTEMLQIGDRAERTYIIKPDRGSQGRGILLIQEPDEVPNSFSDGNGAVAQKYIKPFLIDGKKFDLRIYVLLTSLNPLHVYIHKEGMARFCTETYQDPQPDNLDHFYSHLTNYSLNKTNTHVINKSKSMITKNKTRNSDELDQIDLYQTPLKRSLTFVMNSIKNCGKNVEQLQEEIDNMIRFTLAAVQPFLSSSYHSVIAVSDGKCRCFEILGFDVLIDHELRPWLLEVNCMPSLTTDSEFDRILKHSVIKGALKIVDIKPDFRHLLKERQRELSQGKKKILFNDSENEFRIAREETNWRQLLPFVEIDETSSNQPIQSPSEQVNSSNENQIPSSTVSTDDINDLVKRKKKLNKLKFNYEKAIRVSRDSPLGAAAQTTASKARKKATEMEMMERKKRLSDVPQVRRSIIVTQSLPPLKDSQNGAVKKCHSKSNMPSMINRKLSADVGNVQIKKSLSNYHEAIKSDRSIKSIQIKPKSNDEIPLYMHFYDVPRNALNCAEEEERKLALKKRYQEEIQLGIVDSVFSFYKIPKKNDQLSAQSKFSVNISRPSDISFSKPVVSYNLM